MKNPMLKNHHHNLTVISKPGKSYRCISRKKTPDEASKAVYGQQFGKTCSQADPKCNLVGRSERRAIRTDNIILILHSHNIKLVLPSNKIIYVLHSGNIMLILHSDDNFNTSFGLDNIRTSFG